MKAIVAAFNQEKALVGAFSVIVQPVVDPMDRFTALITNHNIRALRCRPGSRAGAGRGIDICVDIYTIVLISR